MVDVDAVIKNRYDDLPISRSLCPGGTHIDILVSFRATYS